MDPNFHHFIPVLTLQLSTQEMTFIGIYTAELGMKGYTYGLLGADKDALLRRW